ncbi:hypothetical protein AB0M34_22990 [Nocardia sp. NPDC050193]
MLDDIAGDGVAARVGQIAPPPRLQLQFMMYQHPDADTGHRQYHANNCGADVVLPDAEQPSRVVIPM